MNNCTWRNSGRYTAVYAIRLALYSLSIVIIGDSHKFPGTPVSPVEGFIESFRSFS